MKSAFVVQAVLLLTIAVVGMPLASERPTFHPAPVTATPRRSQPNITITATPSPTPTCTPTDTLTPTSHPGPPTLIAPENGALLPQPVPPHEWHFVWSARTGPCWSSIGVSGPGGRGFYAEISWRINGGYQHTYTQTEYLPDDALTPWCWSVSVTCPLGNNHSDIYTFSVEPAFHSFLPVLLKDDG
jgi:hypothetical protein